jgi:hypothetical protein
MALSESSGNAQYITSYLNIGGGLSSALGQIGSSATAAVNNIASQSQSVLGNFTQQLSQQPSGGDLRVRLSPLYLAKTTILGPAGSSNILNPLYATNGLMFPYSPQITVSQDVNYQDISMVHTNSDFLSYQKTPSVSISITGKFSCQTQAEGAYSLACIHYLRTVSKMYFGQTDKNAGLPPPILLLNGYGTFMFNNLRVILKSHNYTYNEQMDTVLISTAGGTARLPALFDLSLTLVVQQTPRSQRQDFNLDAFRTGALLLQANNTTKQGWI